MGVLRKLTEEYTRTDIDVKTPAISLWFLYPICQNIKLMKKFGNPTNKQKLQHVFLIFLVHCITCIYKQQ